MLSDSALFGGVGSAHHAGKASHPGEHASNISEVFPSDLSSEVFDSALPPEPGSPAGSHTRIPLIGRLPVGQQQRLLGGLASIGLIALVIIALNSQSRANIATAQVGAAGQSLMQSQRLAKAMSQAITGSPAAFPELQESAEALGRGVRALAGDKGEIGGKTVAEPVQAQLRSLLPLVDRAEKNTATVLAQQSALVQVREALQRINQQSSELLQVAETIFSLKLQRGASTAEGLAAGQLAMLTQRIGKSANEFLTIEGVHGDAVLLLSKDLEAFRKMAEGLLGGDAALRLGSARDVEVREQLERLLKLHEETQLHADAILGNLQGMVAARKAHAALLLDSEPLRVGLERVQQELAGEAGFDIASLVSLLSAGGLAICGFLGLAYVAVHDQRQRTLLAEQQRLEAERMEREAKRVNEANQAAILRLMNELQLVAEGDLTQQATVTEDITGAIADSVNYTVEELRSLVAQVQGTVARVTQTTQQVEATSSELLEVSTQQLREIHETGESVLQMASRINKVSAQAQQSAQVARQSLQAAESGLKAVQNAIGGMDSIRDQIQDTSKRIKRLGESSQEIGEITELISDITEQTNVLALNAAIQAASAGEAGRGFSVVAEEVQRLAERSADATRQIAVLVRTIQTDTQDAVAAMERSTHGVVEGTKLSDAAGAALGEIDRVSRRLAELIEQISAQALREAESANVVAGNIQHIFDVTEQTGEGTRSTAQLVRELSKSAEELKQSVSRFTIV